MPIFKDILATLALIVCLPLLCIEELIRFVTIVVIFVYKAITLNKSQFHHWYVEKLMAENWPWM